MATALASGIDEFWPPDMSKSSQSTSSNPKPDKASRQMDKKFVKNQDSKKVPVGPKGQPSKRNNRKGENPM